jgi:hypothetical protein
VVAVSAAGRSRLPLDHQDPVDGHVLHNLHCSSPIGVVRAWRGGVVFGSDRVVGVRRPEMPSKRGGSPQHSRALRGSGGRRERRAARQPLVVRQKLHLVAEVSLSPVCDGRGASGERRRGCDPGSASREATADRRGQAVSDFQWPLDPRTGKLASGRATAIPVVQTAETGKGDDLAKLRWLYGATVGEVLPQGQVRSVLVVPVAELAKRALGGRTGSRPVRLRAGRGACARGVLESEHPSERDAGLRSSRASRTW